MPREIMAPVGPYAIDPKAFGLFFCEYDPSPTTKLGNVPVVHVRGALWAYKDGASGDSYESILERVTAAFEQSPTVAIAFDTPGGVVSGCFDAAKQLRAIASRPGRCLVGYVSGQATSAGYALLSGCTKAYASPSALIGSIGVITQLEDMSEHLRSFGVSIRPVTSGARKADGNPMKPTSDAEVAATQKIVDDQASIFFDHVAAMRGVSVEFLRSLEASTYVASQSPGLVDGICSLEEAIAGAVSPAPTSAASGTTTEENTMSAIQKAIDALRVVAEGDDEVEAAAAKKALAAIEAEGTEEEGEAKAEGDEGKEEEGDEGKEEEATKAAQALATSAETAALVAQSNDPLVRALFAQSQAQANALTQLNDSVQRDKLLASRPDFDAKTVAELKDAPLATVQFAVKNFPRAQTPAVAALQPGVKPVVGSERPMIDPDEDAALDLRMGLVEPEVGVVKKKLENGATVVQFGAFRAKGGK